MSARIAKAVAVLGVLALTTGPLAHASLGSAIPIRPELEARLAMAAEPLIVLVSGDDTRTAVRAVQAAGLHTVEVFDRFGLVAAVGAPETVRALHRQPGVRRVDANLALEPLDDLAHRSTGLAALRETQAHPALSDLRRSDGKAFDGTGISIAVVDGGFDTTHEQFGGTGASKFDVHLRQACALPREFVAYGAGTDPAPDCAVWQATPGGDDDPDGHGTIVAAAAAGDPRMTPSGDPVSGVAPGARLVGLSTGIGPATYNGFSALNWVLEHHAQPCGTTSCAPIRVVNASWGLPADDDIVVRRFDPAHPISRVTTALVEAGVVVVFAAGNSGGEGTRAETNVFGLNPLPGALMIGSYFDGNAGDHDMMVSRFSSRGKTGEPETYPDVLAPGENVLTGCAPGRQHCSVGPGLDGDYGSFSGTSLAAPYMAGVVAMLLEADPSLTPAQIEKILEDSAHQLGPQARLEPDVYTDWTGTVRGNPDHLTSFDAGHGNVDIVRALGTVLAKDPRTAPDTCPHGPATSVDDPSGDARILYQASPVDQPALDVLEVATSLDTHPGALTVVVTYADLTDVPSTREHTSILVSLDTGGERAPSVASPGGWTADAEVTLDRDAAGDTFATYGGGAAVEGTVDAAADTATFLILPQAGPIQDRASVTMTWTSTRDNGFIADGDITGGACTVWLS